MSKVNMRIWGGKCMCHAFDLLEMVSANSAANLLPDWNIEHA